MMGARALWEWTSNSMSMEPSRERMASAPLMLDIKIIQPLTPEF